MVSDSVLIRSALEAASTAHLHNLGVVSTLEATRLQSKALRHLSGALSTATSRIDSTIFLEELVSATFLLVYYETALGLSAQTARWHLSAAKSILNSLTQNARQSQSLDSLIRIFLYFDLMVALSLRLEPLANLGMFASLVQRSFCPTFGYSLTLYPHLHSLTCLLAQKYISIDSDLWMDEKSVRELECDLLCWQPSTMPPETTAVWSSREDTSQWTTHQAGGELHERCLETALAFRSTALLVLTDELLPLFSATPSFPPNVHYTNLLNHLLRLNTLAQVSPPSATSSSTYLYPSSSTTAPTMTITWPLHTAALHAKSSSDRQLLSCLFEHVYHRHRMGMIRAARRQVEQVWCEDEKVKGRVDGGGRCRSLLEEDERRNGDVVEMAPLLA